MTRRLTSRWRVLAAGAAVALAGSLALQSPASAVNPKPTDVAGKVQVCGLNLCDKNGKPVQLRGMSSHGLQWTEFDGCLSDKALDSLADSWKSDLFRLSMYSAEGGYAYGSDAKRDRFDKKIDSLINRSYARGMYTIADWHILADKNPMTNKEMAKRFFRNIATKHGDKGTVIYEIANEPNGNGVTWDVIKRYAEEMVPFIRQYDPDAVILVGTPAWSSLDVSGNGQMQKIFDNPIRVNGQPAQNVMYTFHYYAAEHGNEPGDPYYKAIDTASKKIPMFVSEWGMEEASGDGRVDKAQSERFVKLLDQRKISWAKWNYADNGYSGSAFKSGTCAKGGPFDGSSLTESGAWVRDKLRATAPGQI